MLLQELGHIDLRTGEGRDIFDISYYTIKNNWKVEIRNHIDPPHVYIISGKNGKITGKIEITYSE